MPDLHAAIAGAVRAERTRAGLTQEQLAARVGWGRDAIIEIEAGRRPLLLEETPALLRALGATLDRLLLTAPPRDRETLGL